MVCISSTNYQLSNYQLSNYHQLSLNLSTLSHSIGNFSILLDVRQQREWDDGHLPNATFIESLHKNKDTTRINNCKNCAIAVYCTTGVRSKWAADTLEKSGFTNVYDVLGINQWTNAGTVLVNTQEVDPDCEEVNEPENCDCDKCISTKVMAVSAAGNTFDKRSKMVTTIFSLVGVIILYINS